MTRLPFFLMSAALLPCLDASAATTDPVKVTAAALHAQAKAAANTQVPLLQAQSDAAGARFRQVSTIAAPAVRTPLPPPPPPGQLFRPTSAATGGAK